MSELYLMKNIIEKSIGDIVIVVTAEKPDWLILKDKKLEKTFGCIRLNKRSFATLYIDSKDKYNLSEKFNIPQFKDVDIKSRLTGNFYQNKFNFHRSKDIKLIIAAIYLSLTNNYAKVEDKIRS